MGQGNLFDDPLKKADFVLQGLLRPFFKKVSAKILICIVIQNVYILLLHELVTFYITR